MIMTYGRSSHIFYFLVPFLISLLIMTKVVLLVLQVVLYEDELADNGVSLLTVKVVSLESVASCSLNRFEMLSLKMMTSPSMFSESHAKLLVSSLAILGELLISVLVI